ncbi:putative cysteine peptidase [Mycoplasma sp. Z473B]|uniref:putative cysteine peptidase n=1 Tax=Mycoplasma sp. Z473B TaxID=3401667 RepID=UPI003AAAEAB7
MNKKTFIIASSCILTSSVFATSFSQNVSNTNEYTNEFEFIKESETDRVNRLTNLDHKLLFTKEIEDLNGRKLCFFAFDKSVASIVDKSTLITLQTDFLDYKSISNKTNLIYLPADGVYERKDSNTLENVISKKNIEINSAVDNVLKLWFPKSSEIKNEQMAKRKLEKSVKTKMRSNKFNETWNTYLNDNWQPYDFKNQRVPGVSHITPNSWWWASRTGYKRIGYYDYEGHTNDTGACDFIAFQNLVLYNEIFNFSNIFTDELYNEYFTEDTYNKIVPQKNKLGRYSGPVYKYAYNQYNPEILPKTLGHKLYELADYNHHFWNGQTMVKMFDKLVSGRRIKENYKTATKYGGFWQAYNTVRNQNRPAILAFGYVRESWGHAFVAYGYDDNSDQFLVTSLWGQEKTSCTLISYYLHPVGSYYFDIIPQGNVTNNLQRKAFNWDNKSYTALEFKELIKNGKIKL